MKIENLFNRKKNPYGWIFHFLCYAFLEIQPIQYKTFQFFFFILPEFLNN